MPENSLISIGALAERTKVPIETIRFYERDGLLKKPHRSAGGHRLYRADSDVRRLLFIRRARDLGFNLDDVRHLLDLAESKSNKCSDVYAVAAPHLHKVRSKLADLRRMEKVLSELVKACATGVVVECPLLETLSR